MISNIDRFLTLIGGVMSIVLTDRIFPVSHERRWSLSHMVSGWWIVPALIAALSVWIGTVALLLDWIL